MRPVDQECKTARIMKGAQQQTVVFPHIAIMRKQDKNMQEENT